MTALRDIQSAFISDIYSGEKTSIKYLTDDNFGAAERLDIYFNNTLFALTDVLASIYPVIEKIVGEQFFKTIARYYIPKYPQPVGNRHMFGGNLSVFLKDFEPAKEITYLEDIAKLEWAYFQASIVDDAESLSFEKLSELSSSGEKFYLKLHPSVFLIEVKFNVLAIWQEHQKEKIGDIELEINKENLLIWRNQENETFIKSLLNYEAFFINSFKENTEFNKIISILSEELEDISELQSSFAQMMSLGVFKK